MSDCPANIRIAVDPTNPGQFFACCGLLELADRLWPGAEGCFGDGVFSITCDGQLKALLNAICTSEVEPVLKLHDQFDVDAAIAPLLLKLGESGDLLLDGWVAFKADKGRAEVTGSVWKFWAGNQSSLGIWGALREALRTQVKTQMLDQPNGLFDARVQMTSRFGFDPGPSWDSLDVGHSLNERRNKTVATSPSLELFAAIGIRRFRPVMSLDKQSFIYAIWECPLAPGVAWCACAGVRIIQNLSFFESRIVSRGQGYYGLRRSKRLAKGDSHG
jgi:CRISPR-associated protein Csb3